MLDKLHSTNTGVNQVQDRVARALETDPGSIGNGRLLSGLIMASGTPLSVAHLLGRVPVGAFPVLASAKIKYAVTSPTNSHITLEVDANGTYSFWVF